MSLYAYLDWKYTLPCSARIPKEIRPTLHPWIDKASWLSGDQLRKLLRARWSGVPGPLQPLRDRVLEGEEFGILGCQGRQWLESTAGSPRPDCDWPYVSRAWATPSGFDVDKARAYLIGLRSREYTPQKVADMSPDTVEFHAYHEWADHRFPDDYREDSSDEGESFTLFVAPPTPPEVIDGRLRSLGLVSMNSLRTFLIHFDQLRESPPRMAGGFFPAAEWRTIKEESEQTQYCWYKRSASPEERSEWGRAAIIFHALNGDRVYLHPDGRVAWQVLSEHRVDVRWKSFEEFIRHYAEALEYRWPFDSYGPSEGARRARMKRRNRPSAK